MKSESLSQWVELAFQYGPFFFSILFLIFISRSARQSYNRVSVRRDPPPTEKEMAVHRWVFITSFAVGILLVAASVVWWFGYKPSVYVFRGTIKNLREYEKLDSDGSIYFRSELRRIFAGDETQLRNEHFVAIQETPFRRGQTIQIDFGKGQEKRNTFEIAYSPEEVEAAFVIEWNDKEQRNIMKKFSVDKKSAGLFSVDRLVFAQSILPQSIPVDRGVTVTRRVQPTNVNLTFRKLVDDLQSPYTDVGSKIVATEQISKLDPATFKECLTTKTQQESMLVTLLDLKRHTDKELASKANQVLIQFDVEGYLAQQLGSDNVEVRKDAQEALFHMDKAQAERVIKTVDAKKTPGSKLFFAQFDSYSASRSVRATGSLNGDRYYVKAEWDPSNGETVSCLTRLFHDELQTSRTIDQEAVLMRGRKERLVYWYSKEWAIGITGKIEHCGGKASFVGLQDTFQLGTPFNYQ